jgi:hypothetical protein
MAAGGSGALTPSDWTIIQTMILLDAERAPTFGRVVVEARDMANAGA